jgi:hypothetical protein
LLGSSFFWGDSQWSRESSEGEEERKEGGMSRQMVNVRYSEREGEIKRDDMKINPVLNILSEFVHHHRACICIRVFAHNNHRG